jgi:hypothetical protein
VPPSLQAQVVRPTLQQRRVEVFRRHPFDLLQRLDDVRDVFGQELLLEIDGVGRHDDPDVVLQGVQRRGDQVGERLADAGAGLDHQPPAFAYGPCDGPRHLDLLRPLLEAAYGPGHGTVSAQHRRDFVRVDGGDCPVRAKRPAAVQPASQRPDVDAGHAGAGGGRRALREPVLVEPPEQVGEYPGRPRGQTLHFRKSEHVHFGRHVEQPQEDVARYGSVFHGSMRARVFDAERAGQLEEGVVPQQRQQDERHVPRIGPRIGERQPAAPQEVEVEGDVVSDDRRRAYEGRQPGRDLGERRRAVHVVLADAGVAADEAIQAAVRVDQGGIGVQLLFALKLDGADLYDLVAVRGQPRRFQVERDPRVLDGRSLPRQQRYLREGACAHERRVGQFYRLA